MSDGETWKLIRSRQQHFTDAERALIRASFEGGRRARDVARELQCSIRVIQTHYLNLRCDERARTPKPPPATPRFYRSDFEPS